MTKARKITYIALLGVVAALLVVGGLYDLDIADALYAPKNVVAQIFESIGIFPPFVIVAATFAALFFVLDGRKKYYALKRIACVAATALAYILFGYMAINETSLSISWLSYVVGVAFGAAFTPLTLWLISRMRDVTRRKLLVFLIFASIVCVIADILAVNVLKFIFSRPRYREMMAAEDFTVYSAWYKINAFSLHGHHSFPSGHTASAGALFVLCAIGEVFTEYKSKEKFLAFVVALYTVTMAYSRLVLGAHFLSDVTAGFAVAFVTYAVTRYLYFKMTPVEAFLNEETKEPAIERAEETEDVPSEEETAQEEETA